uniref:NADH-ubiquinone oxidoreductase chain 4L n=1 Tax=Diaphanes pectinealis TaxID=370597 RepID=A0A5C0PZK6_9COLE|nr:NADH dehydrogenase subunit 4L [Diaphanes pectinealis]QEJ81665.1 NADH dehydrogenase subunit 4L [Diaphanes pectinealis]
MLININYLYLMYFIGMLVFSFKCKHLLLMLLSLEFMILSLYYGIYFVLCMYSHEYNFIMVFLSMSVCEGVLGLSILVSMIRSFGNDYFHSFNILW